MTDQFRFVRSASADTANWPILYWVQPNGTHNSELAVRQRSDGGWYVTNGLSTHGMVVLVGPFDDMDQAKDVAVVLHSITGIGTLSVNETRSYDIT